MTAKIKSGEVNENGELINYVNGGSITYSPKSGLIYLSIPHKKSFVWINKVTPSTIARLFKLGINPEFRTRVLDCGQIEFTRKWYFEI